MTLMSRELSDPRTRLYPITVRQYHRMMDQGIIEEGEPYELLNGMIVRKDRSAQGEDPMTVGHEHIYAVSALDELNARFRRLGCYMRIQQPISLPPLSEPEPDGAIARGNKEDYADRLPTSDDLLCVIEVADASLARDRASKLEMYARGGIERYFIVNLRDRMVECYGEPVRRKGRYAPPLILSSRQKVTFPTARGKRITIPVKVLFPPAAPARGSRNGHR
jgi:Uma2 family endonuclease